MILKDYKLEPGYQLRNQETLVEYDDAVKVVSEIMEDISINETPYGMKCYKAYQKFFDVCCREKVVVLDELKNRHQEIENYLQLFSYDQSTVQKLTTLKAIFEAFFETFAYMLEKIKEAKLSYDEQIEEYSKSKGYLTKSSREQMEAYFKNQARFIVALANQMEDFVDDHIKPKFDLYEIITSMELDFNQAIMYHKIKSKIEKEQERE